MERRDPTQKALVLAGGGARGSYQVGVWRALMELDWHPQIITGTSVGTKNITGVTNTDDVKVYSVANGNDTKVIVKLSNNRKLSISAWYMHGNTLRGKFTDGDVTGWIDMAYLDQDALTAKVVVDVVNFYTDNSDAPGTLVSNLNLRLNAATTVIKRTLKDGVAWGKVSDGKSETLPQNALAVDEGRKIVYN